MNERVLERLEFPKVCHLVGSRTASVLGRQRAHALRPTADASLIRTALELVGQMHQLMVEGVDPGPIEVGDLRNLIHRLQREEELFEPLELITLGKLLSISTRVRQTLDREEIANRFAALHEVGCRFGDFEPIVRRIEAVFDPTGDFLDTASARLGKIRRKLRQVRTSVSADLEQLARRQTSHPEETFVTLREGRYVLAVKSVERGRLPGVVHGHSKTGQTVFLEPLATVEQNNAISGLEGDEQEERLAILRELSRSVFDRREEIGQSYEASADLDLIRAKARLSLDLDGRIPSFNTDRTVRLVRARHPLLVEATRGTGGRVVPLDLEMGQGGRTLLVSGPNMGGKTVALKTVGLLCLMAQAGIPIPVDEGTDLPLCDQLFVDLGDEQSIERETSTFAAHLQNLAEAYRHATDRSLILLDELGGGTDPEEGTALGRALIELMTERGTLLLATTHLVGLKIVAHEDPKMRNGAMEFDPTTQKPTYRLRLGAPGRSRAFELAEQILPPGELIERAERYRTRWSAALDEVLGQLERRQAELTQELELLKRKEEELEASREKKEELTRRCKERLELLRERRWENEGRALDEVERLLVEVRRMHEQAAASASGSGRRSGVREELRDLAEQIDRMRVTGRSRRGRHQRPIPPDRLTQGQTAWSRDFKSLIKIDSEPDATHRVWIIHGGIRFHVPIDSLSEPEPDQLQSAPVLPRRERQIVSEPESGALRQIDLRGLAAEDAVRETEKAIDRAAISGLSLVRIVHGKGTGTLKREIDAFLEASPLVESFRSGTPQEGGWGATIVVVRSAQWGD